MQVGAPLETSVQPLTALSEEEKLFQSTVRRFARDEIGPHVREMDEAGVFRKDIIRQFFDLGLMGIEIPEEFGGQAGTFFQCVMAVEELSAVDPSAGVIVDVQNTIVNNAILRWANAEQKKRYLPRLAADTVSSYALSEAGSGSDAFAMSTRAEDRGDHFISLQVDAANLAGAVVDVVIGIELGVLKSRLHDFRIGEVLLDVGA